MLLIQRNEGGINCVSKNNKIKYTVITENDFGIVWMCQGAGYEMRFLAEFKDRIMP